jgi:DNA-binding NarL/FixJ family response regulator
MDRTAITVFIADDHELVRFALRKLLETEPDLTVVGEAGDSEGAVAGCAETNPDVLLLDLRMPGTGGVEVCRQVRVRCPDTSVLVLTSFDEDEEVFGVLSAGACGYILKDTRPEHLVSAIRSVADGQTVFDPTVAGRIISGRDEPTSGDGTDQLSSREMEVLQLMAQGCSNKEIGRLLWIGETTVKTHVSHILRKFGKVDRTQAVLEGVRLGVIRLDP